MQRWIIRLLFVAPLVVLSAWLAARTLAPYLPSTADLEEVQQIAKPRLEDQLAQGGFKIGQPLFIRIFKETSELEVWLRKASGYERFKTYPICNYSGVLGPKLKEGDRQSPEGFYHVAREQLNPNSSYHLSFNLGFPNAYDRSHQRTGSYLMVHGNCVSIGCYAMTDAGIEEIYLLAEAALASGQKHFQVQAFPFRMTAENLARHSGSNWLQFWNNLKQGYDAFEETRVPPIVRAENGIYVFADAEG